MSEALGVNPFGAVRPLKDNLAPGRNREWPEYLVRYATEDFRRQVCASALARTDDGLEGLLERREI
jgi:hypothetical protein